MSHQTIDLNGEKEDNETRELRTCRQGDLWSGAFLANESGIKAV